MCTSNENQVKVALAKSIYEFLKMEYIDEVRSYIKTHKSVDLSEINPVVSIPADTRIKNVCIDGTVLGVTRKYLNMNSVDFECINGNDGYLYFKLSGLEYKQDNKKSL